MPSWDIQPAGVEAVLSRTQGVAEEFNPEMTSLSGGLTGSMDQSSSPIVAEAVEGFAASSQGSIDFVFGHTTAAIRGAADATSAYVAGDLEMAANAQAAAAGAPDPTAVMPGMHGPR
jgi:hypothetical protein